MGDKQFLDNVRSRTRLVDLIARDVVLKQKGRGDWWGCCPFHGEKTASFHVDENKGFAHCFGCGWHGDAFGWLTDYHGMTFPEAVEELAVQAGLQADREGRKRPEAKPVQRETAKDRAQSDAKKLARAREIWSESLPVAHSLVETYLWSRNIRVERLPGWPVPTLRYHPNLAYWLPPKRKGDSPQLLGRWPAMVAYVQRPDRSFAGVHQTWLRSDGTGKAPVPKAKKMLGRVFGGHLRLCPAAAAMGVAEGIETSLSVMLATGLPVWAALSEGNLGAALPPVCRTVTICADNDTKDKATTDHRIGSATAGHASRCCRVSVARPPDGMDFNDLLGAVA